MKADEVKQLARLRVIDLPITAVRIHRQPRGVLQPPPAGKRRKRITVMLLEKRGDAVVTQEDSKEVENHPKRRTSMRWRGITLFAREDRGCRKKKRSEEGAYIQVGNVMYSAPVQMCRCGRNL